MRLSEAHFFILRKKIVVEIIYKNKYATESIAEAEALYQNTESEIQNILLAHPFFSAQPTERLEMFLNVALAGNRLAAHEDAEIEISVAPEENTAKVFLKAPCFLFQLRELTLWQKICLLASEIEFTPNATIAVSFDFSPTGDNLYRHFLPKE